jgi:hypothetical protein
MSEPAHTAADLIAEIRAIVYDIIDSEEQNLVASLSPVSREQHSERLDRRNRRLADLRNLLEAALPVFIHRANAAFETVEARLHALYGATYRLAWWDMARKDNGSLMTPWDGRSKVEVWAYSPRGTASRSYSWFRDPDVKKVEADIRDRWLALAAEVRVALEPVKNLARGVGKSGGQAPDDAGTGNILKPAALIAIDGDHVLVNGQIVPLNMTAERLKDVLHFLSQLIENCGQWVSGPDISKAAPDRYNDRYRWDRVQRSLPPVITDHIETDRRKGKRLKPLR